SNQVSNWLSGLSKDVDLGLNYRPGDAISQEEVELAVSTQLFNERLLVNTTVGVQYGQATSSSTQSQLIGDVQVEYLISPDGKMRLKAYNLSNDQNLNRADQAQYTQGVGIGYRREFDRVRELFRGKRKRKEDQAAP
ncbi:MAG: translocation/assembly module TamB domain-containing protein, partial [Flavobacteriales bacterium]|nr:translocation/assembly module TamB domain-containing protein [Flavobacteriales bacterium]